MINCLREQFLYSEKRARDLLFRAIEELVCVRGETMIVSRLTREAASLAREFAQKGGYEFTAWETASKAVVNSMLAAGVLLTHGSAAIQPGVAAQATEVSTLKEEYRDITEGYLLEFLITKLRDVTTRDHIPLAHALFRQFDPSVSMQDFEDRVVVLLAKLAGRIVLYPDGTYAPCMDPEPSIS